MSRFSGKCDLFDHISGQAGYYLKDGTPAKVGNGTGPYYSDEYKDFLVFKERTGGVIYQHKKVVVSEWNQEDVKKHCNGFDFIQHSREIKDSRYKDGIRKEKYYTYVYWGKEYNTLKELNKKGVYATLSIHFDTLLDIIPFYPYVVVSCASYGDKETLFISELPYPIEERDDSLKTGGRLFDSWQYYHKELQEHYRDVVLWYYNPTGKEVIEEVTFLPEKQDATYYTGGPKYKFYGQLSNKIDDQFPVEWVIEKEDKTYWSSPKILANDISGKGWIEMSEQDYKGFLGGKCKVKYVKLEDRELNLQ